MIENSSDERKVAINGRQFTFRGDDGDFYFENLPAFADGDGERQLLRFIERHLKPTSTCLDIGANIGLTTAMLAAACPQGHVYAFEPAPKNARNLRKNLAINQLTNTSVIERAVGASCEMTLITQPIVGANSTIMRDAGPRAIVPGTARVGMITIDSWAQTLVAPVDFIKVDVEGFEANVLAGAAEVITRDRPAIFMEFNSVTIAFEARQSPLAFAETIWRLFDVFKVDSEGCLNRVEIRSFVLDNMVRNGCIDDIVLYLKAGIDAQMMRDTLMGDLAVEMKPARSLKSRVFNFWNRNQSATACV